MGVAGKAEQGGDRKRRGRVGRGKEEGVGNV